MNGRRRGVGGGEGGGEGGGGRVRAKTRFIYTLTGVFAEIARAKRAQIGEEKRVNAQIFY